MSKLVDKAKAATPMRRDELIQALRCALALLFLSMGKWVTNAHVFPLFDAIMPEVRDISTLINALALIALTFVAYRAPWLIREKLLTALALGGMVLGAALTVLGVMGQSAWLLLLGSSLSGLWGSWGLLLCGLSLVYLRPSLRLYSIIGGVTASYLLAPLLPRSFYFGFVFNVAAIAVILLIRRYSLSTFQEVAGNPSPAVLAITGPNSFLPLAHRLYITVFCFSLASGFALTYGAVASAPPPNFLTIVPLLLLACVVVARRAKVNLDRLFELAALIVLAGFLAIPVLGTPSSSLVVPGFGLEIPVVNVLINTGADFFIVTLWVVLSSLASRNQLGALTVIASGQAAVTLGTLAGAMMGNLTNSLDPGGSIQPLPLAMLLALAFVAYLLIGMRTISFEQTISRVESVVKPTVRNVSPALEPACQAVAKRYNLTAREQEVLELLARGRNSSSIQDILVVSHNTAKTHVKNIYAKLGIHSQQELIDLVEQQEQ